MKTENKNMRIMEPGNTTEEREAKGTKYKPVQPVVLDTIPEDAYLSAPLTYANCSTSATRH